MWLFSSFPEKKKKRKENGEHDKTKLKRVLWDVKEKTKYIKPARVFDIVIHKYKDDLIFNAKGLELAVIWRT